MAGTQGLDETFSQPGILQVSNTVALWPRFRAGLIDAVIITCLYFGSLVAVAVASAQIAALYVLPGVVIESLSYFAAFWMWSGATPGQAAMHLQVVPSTGNCVTARVALLRYLGYVLSLIAGGIGFIWGAFDSSRQGWPDKLAGTFVVERPHGSQPNREPHWISSDQQHAASQLSLLAERIQEELVSPVRSAGHAQQRLAYAEPWTTALPKLVREIQSAELGVHHDSWIHRVQHGWARWHRRRWVHSVQRLCLNLLVSAREEAEGTLRRARLSEADPTTSIQQLRSAFARVPVVGIAVHERVAYIDLTAPANIVPKTFKTTRKTRGGVQTVERPRPQREVNHDFKEVVAGWARSAIDCSLREVPGLEGVVVSLFQPSVHPTLGHHYMRCILSVSVDRSTWCRIVHANVTAENALRNFALHFQYNKHCELEEVTPVKSLSGGSENHGVIQLHDIDPVAFERLVKDLLTAMGFQATLTKVSGDGGIDVDAVNPQPIVGGRVLVQCKRYRGNIGSPVVRDLYGVVTSERASKGVLITTSDFTPDARSFAAGKPLELISGHQLVSLLRHHGFSVNYTVDHEVTHR